MSLLEVYVKTFKFARYLPPRMLADHQSLRDTPLACKTAGNAVFVFFISATGDMLLMVASKYARCVNLENTLTMAQLKLVVDFLGTEEAERMKHIADKRHGVNQERQANSKKKCKSLDGETAVRYFKDIHRGPVTSPAQHTLEIFNAANKGRVICCSGKAVSLLENTCTQDFLSKVHDCLKEKKV